MKKRILSFVLLMLMVLTSFASAAGISYVASEGDMSFTTVTFANDGTNVTASLKGIKAQGTDTVTLMMTMYNGKNKLIDAASSKTAVGTEEAELKASLPIPSGDYTVAASLFNAANGLSPIAAPAYSDYEGSTDLVDLKVEGATIEGFASGVYEYKYVTEGAATYPEISATVAEGSSKVSVEYEDTFPGIATITVANALGTVSSVYKIDFTPLRHIVVGATSDSDFDTDSGTNLNLMSKNDVSKGVGGKKIYTNLTGADNDSPDYGSRWVTDYYPLGSRHAIRSVDSMLQGWDYFVSPNGAMKKDEGNYFEFEVNHNARIVVVALAAEPSLTANGFEALPSKTYVKASFITGGASVGYLADLTKLGITATFADIEFYNANKDNHTAVCNYFTEKYNLDPEKALEGIPVYIPDKAVTLNVFEYKNAYSKFYEAYEDEPAKVIIPAPQATQSRGYIVVVIPVGEDGEIPEGGNEGGETPDTPVVPDTPTNPLGELTSLVNGKTYSQYIDYVNSVVSADKAMTKEATVSETQKISTNYNEFFTLTEEGVVCSVSDWRVFRNVAEGWDGLTFMTTDPSFYQNDSGRGWPVTMFSGKASAFSGDTCEGTDNQIVPWWTVRVNEDMNVSIVTDKELTHLTDKGWTKLTIGTDIDNPFTIYDNRNGNPVSGSNQYVYTKAFSAGDTVELYNENAKSVTYVPYIAVFDTPDVGGNEGGGEPEPDTPTLAEGNHIIAGARYTDEIVADTGVTNGYKSAAAVTSEKATGTDGIVYTNLRGNPDETTDTYGARLCSNMPANSTSYHEVYYADESIAGSDYFVFSAGGNAHSDATLLKFDIAADAEVSILTTNSAMSFAGFTLKENANGWIKGRFINRNMADAMNAIGVTPLYSVVKTFKKAESDAFYNTYLKAAYDAAEEQTAKDEFDKQWALFVANGTPLGNDSAYKAMYTATFKIPEGQDTLTVTVPGNTNTSASSRNILVVVKPAESEEEPDLSEDAEVTALIAQIDAIGEVTLESETAIVEARAAYDALSAEKQAYVTNLSVLEAAEAALEELKAQQPVLTEGFHPVVGARYEGELVADTEVENGMKSSAKVTTAGNPAYNGILYTNFRGLTQDNATGARWTTDSWSAPLKGQYHEVYYADESLIGYDYFTATAGDKDCSSSPLIEFELAESAEVVILSIMNSFAVDGFAMEQNADSWAKGRYYNTAYLNAIEKLGVASDYDIAMKLSSSNKATFIDTYYADEYAALDDTARGEFDTLWASVGSGFGSAFNYNYAYSKTYTVPEGETLTVTIPGDTSGVKHRTPIIIIKAVDEAEEPVIPAEVTALIAQIDAIGEVTLESKEAIEAARTAYDALSADQQALVTNYSVLEAAEEALAELEAAAEVDHVGTLTSKVSGLTYAKYLEYVESVTGEAPVSTSVIKDTEVIATSTIVIRDSFTVGGQIGSESARRVLEAIDEDYAFLAGVKFFSPTIEWSQQDTRRRWYTKIFWGEDATYNYNEFDYTVNAATDALPTVPWWTIPVTQATVYITSYVEMPHLEDAGWTKADSTDPVFTWKDTNNNAVSNGPAVVYTKEVTDTETVELPNSNTGKVGTYPYFVFFVPNN